MSNDVSVGDRVHFKVQAGKCLVGHVSDRLTRNNLRLIDYAGKQYTTAKSGNGQRVARASVMPINFGVRVFDTVLETRKGDSVSRNASDYWDSFCRASNWKFTSERIHSLQDLEHFFTKVDIAEPVVIFSGHGTGRKGFGMTNGDCYAGQPFSRPIKPKNEGKIIILSACEIGWNRALCSQIKQNLAAQAVLAYQHVMFDNTCFLIESHFLTLIEDDSRTVAIQNAYATTKTSTDSIRKVNRAYLKKSLDGGTATRIPNAHPFVCYS